MAPEQLSTMTEMAAETARLREALLPFARALEKTSAAYGFDVSRHYITANMVQPHLKMEDFRRAYDALHYDHRPQPPAHER